MGATGRGVAQPGSASRGCGGRGRWPDHLGRRASPRQAREDGEARGDRLAGNSWIIIRPPPKAPFWPTCIARDSRVPALPARRAGRLADPGQSRLGEPDDGITIYLANNGVHADLILPAKRRRARLAAAAAEARFRRVRPRRRMDRVRRGRGAGLSRHADAGATSRRADRLVGADRRRAGDACRMGRAIRPPTRRGKSACAGGISPPVGGDPRRFPARPTERPIRIDHPGYGSGDAFYQGVGKANAISTCNTGPPTACASPGSRRSLWSPFVQGLVWRYREADQST